MKTVAQLKRLHRGRKKSVEDSELLHNESHLSRLKNNKSIAKMNSLSTLQSQNINKSLNIQDNQLSMETFEYEIPIISSENNHLPSFMDIKEKIIIKQEPTREMPSSDSMDSKVNGCSVFGLNNNLIPVSPDDCIIDFKDFLLNFQSRIKFCEWNFKIIKDNFFLYMLGTGCTASTLLINTYICLSQDMSIQVFQEGAQLTENDLSWIFPNGPKLELWTQLKKMLIYYGLNTQCMDDLLDNGMDLGTNENALKIFSVLKKLKKKLNSVT